MKNRFNIPLLFRGGVRGGVLLMLILFTHFSQAQVAAPISQDVLDFLRNFPVAKIQSTIQNLQADLKACEKSKTDILANADSTNRKLSNEITALKQHLNTAEMKTDNIRKNTEDSVVLTKGIEKDIKKARPLGWFERIGIAVGAAYLGYRVGKVL
jgi:hypothetical protein